MSAKNLETIITEILAGSAPRDSRRHHVNAGGPGPPDRPNAFIARTCKRRPQRNPLYTSLRLIILGLVILLVPLLFSGRKVQPPKSTVTGAIAPAQTVIAQLVDARSGQL